MFPTDQRARARRYSLEAPVRYRLPGEQDWKDGRTRNISASGMLFASRKLLQVGTELELVLSLKPSLPLPSNTQVVCNAQIVRIGPSDDPDAPTLTGVRILQYRFAPAQA